MNADRIIFHHLKKSGGTSVIQNLRYALRSHKRIGFEDTVDDLYRFIDNNKKIKIFSSHYAFADYEKRDDEFYITWIRNPVDMFYSAWSFYREQPDKIHLQMVPAIHKTGFNAQHAFDDISEWINFCIDGPRRFFPMDEFNADFDSFNFIGRCEHMNEDLFELSNILGLKFNLPFLPPMNTSNSPKVRTYRRNELEQQLGKEMEIWRKLSER